MGITERRIEFMSTLDELCRENNGPVHYSLVAERLGVSKWTAYDLLTALRDEGYVETLYILNDKGSGRSTVAFKLTDKGKDLIYKDTKEENVTKLSEEMRTRLKSFEGLSVNELLQSGLKEISPSKTPVLKALNISIVIFMLSQKLAVNWDNISSSYQILSKSIDPQSGLLGLTALLIGVILAKAGINKYGNTVNSKIGFILNKYKEILDELSHKDKEFLFDITKEIYTGNILLGEEE